eukprot:CAMPEP_0119393972 /NCGR_PEP_ID=MMETSP1334-20130426/127380_1 /TAXON_ID=127549 /ORGANISM="Calcidiscus leptoporus, Strain RCC1130" /LENGTH=62 /DNA_ID=CAMNT_0007417141 /DNA_START=20 /DNA_END=204 /DNA_ORIENTATION=+
MWRNHIYNLIFLRPEHFSATAARQLPIEAEAWLRHSHKHRHGHDALRCRVAPRQLQGMFEIT